MEQKVVIIILSSILFVSIFFNIFIPCQLTRSHDYYHEYQFKYWTKNSKSLEKIKNYIKDISTKKNKNYIPKEDRIAIFDMDGTIFCEKFPLYITWTFYLDIIKENKTLYNNPQRQKLIKKMNDYIKGLINDEDLEIQEIKDEAKIFENWTVKNYMEFIRKYLERNAYGFKNIKFKDMYYKPMIEIINFLQKNFFKVYIVSGNERFFIREVVSHFLNDVPFEQIIGTDIHLIGKEENISKFDYDNLNHYDYTNFHTDYLIKSDKVAEYSVKFTKVRLIAKEIGRKPVLSFGNSNGDSPVHNYVLYNNKYKAMAFMVVADDMKREYGIDVIKDDGNVDTTNSDKKKAMWKDDNGYEIISMRDDFKTIYGDGVILDK